MSSAALLSSGGGSNRSPNLVHTTSSKEAKEKEKAIRKRLDRGRATEVVEREQGDSSTLDLLGTVRCSEGWKRRTYSLGQNDLGLLPGLLQLLLVGHRRATRAKQRPLAAHWSPGSSISGSRPPRRRLLIAVIWLTTGASCRAEQQLDVHSFAAASCTHTG